ncbi:MAG: hypothetical protein KAI47_05385, partial [Deltaproteobacteria bacterium]|nr:hypothetical protein [Deltaproteobacteria bacterium]
DVAFFVKVYGVRGRYRARAARVAFSLGIIADGGGDANAIVRFYDRYLKTWGAVGGEERQILARVRSARVRWKKSCPVKGVHGLCITQKRVRSRRRIILLKGKETKIKAQTTRAHRRKQCGPETKAKIRVYARRKTLVRRALRDLEVALRLARLACRGRGEAISKGEGSRCSGELRAAAAEAKFLIADQLFERFLKLPFPRHLDFSRREIRRKKRPRGSDPFGRNTSPDDLDPGGDSGDTVARRSMKAFARYLHKKAVLFSHARNAYQRIRKMKSPPWAIASVARIGQLYQSFADALFTAALPKPPVPKELRGAKAKRAFASQYGDTYCDTLADKTRPLEAKAIEGFTVCLDLSTRLSRYNTWSRLCDRERNQIDPARFPMATEIVSQPGYLDLRLAPSALFTRSR